MMTRPSVSVFFPCFNDERTIGGLVVAADKILQKIAARYEVIVVNDGSTDGSGKVLAETLGKVESLRVVTHRKNLGYGAALRSGYRNAKYGLVFYTDGDGQYDVSELPLLLSCLTADVDVVNGVKMERQDSFARVLLGHVYKSIMRNLFDLPVYDVDCDFRLGRKKVLRGIRLEASSGAVCVELIKKLQRKGARFRDVSVHHYPRRFGRSQFFRPKPVLLMAKDLVFLWIKFFPAWI